MASYNVYSGDRVEHIDVLGDKHMPRFRRDIRRRMRL